MNTAGKVVFGALAVIGGYKLISAVRAAKVNEEMNIQLINSRLHGADPNPMGGGVIFKTDVLLQNPTKHSLNLTQPHIQLLRDNTVFSYTQVSNKAFTLAPMSQLRLDTVTLTVPWSTIVSEVAGIKYPTGLNFIQKVTYVATNYKKVLSEMNLEMRYTTYANGLFYSETQKIRF